MPRQNDLRALIHKRRKDTAAYSASQNTNRSLFEAFDPPPYQPIKGNQNAPFRTLNIQWAPVDAFSKLLFMPILKSTRPAR